MTFRRAVLLVSLSIFTATAGVARAADSTTTVNVDVLLSLSGPAAFLGHGDAQGFAALENMVNRSGGIRGTPLHFVVWDDQSSPQLAVQLTNELLAKKAPIILGSDFVATCSAMAPLIKSAALAYCLSPGVHPEAGSYIYSAAVGTNDVLAVTVRYFRLRGMKRIGLITSTDGTGQDAERSFDAALAQPESRDVVRVANEHFAVGDVSVRTQLANLRRANPDVVFVWTTGPPFATVLRDMKESGFDIPVAGSTSNLTAVQLSQLAQYGIKVYFPTVRYMDRERIERGKLRDTVDTLYRAFETMNLRPDIEESLVWDPGLLVVSALRALGPNATPAQIKAYIDAQRSFVGINGIYDFASTPQRGLNDRALVMMLWDPAKSTVTAISRPGGYL